MIRVPIGDGEDDDDDGYSSGGSMIRVPVAGNADGDDASSSNGSVVRVNVDEDACSSDGSVLRIPVGVNEANDCSSDDGSVVRRRNSEDPLKAPRQRGHTGETPDAPLDSLTAQNLGLLGDQGRGSSERTVGSHEGAAGQGPARAMEMNLQAAAKYFSKGGQGGASQDCGAVAATQRKGDGSAPTNGAGNNNPEVST